MFKSFILPDLEHGSILFSGIGRVKSNCLEKLQRKAIRIILHIPYRDPLSTADYDLLKLDTLQYRRNFALACFAFKMYKLICPRALFNYSPTLRTNRYEIRRHIYVHEDADQPTVRIVNRTAISLSPRILNILPRNSIENTRSLNSFKISLVTQRNSLEFTAFPHN